MRPRISIIVPFFNEEENVVPLLTELRAVCDTVGQPYEGIFVNDGSQDATGWRLDEAAKGCVSFSIEPRSGCRALLRYEAGRR
jgi:glycosyltransferase involved in cell wall biosynthesis